MREARLVFTADLARDRCCDGDVMIVDANACLCATSPDAYVDTGYANTGNCRKNKVVPAVQVRFSTETCQNELATL